MEDNVLSLGVRDDGREVNCGGGVGLRIIGDESLLELLDKLWRGDEWGRLGQRCDGQEWSEDKQRWRKWAC